MVKGYVIIHFGLRFYHLLEGSLSDHIIIDCPRSISTTTRFVNLDKSQNLLEFYRCYYFAEERMVFRYNNISLQNYVNFPTSHSLEM